MRNYATAQALGSRAAQCDATAIHTAPDGARAYVLLDGIGDYLSVRDWSRKAARRLARAASRRGDAEAGLRHIYQDYAADPDRRDPYIRRYMPSAAAVVVVVAPGRPMTVAWCGDSRAYLLDRGIARRLTADHNDRRVHPPTAMHPGGDRNVITSYLGSAYADEELMARFGHPAIEAATVGLDGPCRLLLASDGAYGPHLDAGHDLFVELAYEPLDEVARDFVALAVETSLRTTGAKESAHSYADNATVLLADLA
ncbi:PP2C family serine/threonine-protein phosphatase [Streptomyces sp. DH12]|uniref:PP2C family protein-serine/threonine phosphatase n=1 Tax=Streptomyces sp. DH12 TaxID=2857010 RepID=UPI001E651408|nr:mucin-2 [Streptomyces sp. DH12]